MKALALLALLSFTAAAQEPPPKVAIYQINGVAVVCMSKPHGDEDASWDAMCAPIGPWLSCTETEETLSCARGKPARFD